MNKPSLALLLLLLLTGCSKYDRDFELDERSFGYDTIQMIERDAHINLPAGARGLNFFYKAPIDPGFAAKIEIPAGSQADLLRQLSEIETQAIHVSGALGPRFKWWTPTQAKVLIDRQQEKTEAYFHAILTEEGNRIILYLERDTR